MLSVIPSKNLAFPLVKAWKVGGVFCVSAAGSDGHQYHTRAGSRYESLVELAEMVGFDLKE